MRERLEVHCRIEQENQRKLRAWKARNLVLWHHLKLFRDGKLDEAWLLLRFLRKGTIRLGLYDSASAVELLLESIGFRPRYGQNYNTAEFSIMRWKEEAA